MRPTTEPAATRHLATASLLLCSGAAIGQLALGILAWPWLAALLVPGALLGLGRGTVHGGPWRFLLGLALQTAACWLAWREAGPLEHPALLAGALLPPLAFTLCRRGPAEASLALFLSFCTLLVGAILGSSSPWSQAVFVLGATLQLRSSSRLEALGNVRDRFRGMAPGSARHWTAAIAIGALTTLLAAGIQQGLAALPRPWRKNVTTVPPELPGNSASTKRRVGLPDEFRFDGEGDLADPDTQLAATVRSVDGSPVPTDLYLRSAAFALAEADQWQPGPQRMREVDSVHAPLVVRPITGRELRFEVELEPASRYLVFVPPEVTAISGIRRLDVDPARECYRQSGADQRDRRYEITFAPAALPPLDATADPAWRAELCQLPADLALPPFQRLLEQWRPHGGALAMAQQIAHGLQRRCTYERKQPTGPYASALLNFIDGERAGFCMHYAAATAILLRMSGVPCRIAIGLHGGDEAGDAAVRGFGAQHSHAWVEIPMPGRGFVAFDPTPTGASEGGPLDPFTGIVKGEEERLAAPLLADLLRRLVPYLRSPWTWLAVLALLAVVPWRSRGQRRAGNDVRAADLRPARRWLARIEAELARQGASRPATATLEAYADLLARRGGLPDAIAAAFAAYQDVRFGGRTFDQEREAQMERGFTAAQQWSAPTQVSAGS